jgi:hypothetical protein
MPSPYPTTRKGSVVPGAPGGLYGPALRGGGRLNPFADPRPWNKVYIGNIELPRILIGVRGAGKSERWEIQIGIGVSWGAVAVWRGTNLAEGIEISCYLPTKDDFDGWRDVCEALSPTIGRRPPALYIVNPYVNWNGITIVTRKDTPPPEPTLTGAWIGRIELIEFNKPREAPVGPEPPPKEPTEADRLANEFAAGLQKASKL